MFKYEFLIFLFIRILTPLAMDQWNWKKEEAILRLGITMACGGVLVKNIHSLSFYDV
jgi:hypothetical protein